MKRKSPKVKISKNGASFTPYQAPTRDCLPRFPGCKSVLKPISWKLASNEFSRDK